MPAPFKHRSWFRTALEVFDILTSPEVVADGELHRLERKPDDDPASWLNQLANGRAVMASVRTSEQDPRLFNFEPGWALEVEIEDGGDRIRRRVVTRDVANAKTYVEGSHIAVVQDGAGGWMLYPPLACPPAEIQRTSRGSRKRNAPQRTITRSRRGHEAGPLRVPRRWRHLRGPDPGTHTRFRDLRHMRQDQ